MRVVCDSRDRAAWLEARKAYVCGSEVAAMLGAGRSFDRAQLVMLKAGLAEPWEGDETTETGQALEDSGFYELCARRKWGWKMEPFGKLLEDEVCSSLASTPDFLVYAPWGVGVAQAKLTTASAQEDCKPTRRDGTPSEAAYVAGAPIYYQLQIQAELACTGFRWGALLVLHAAGGKLKLRSYAVKRHDGVIARMRYEATKVMAEARSLMAGRIA